MPASKWLRRLLPILLPLLLIAQASREESKTLPLAADGRVFIDTYKGSITITTWDRSEVEIHALIESDGRDSRHEEEKVEDTRIRIDVSGNSVRIKSDYKKVDKTWNFFDFFEGEFGSLPFVHYTIKMPVGARLNVKDYKSESSIKGLRSDLAFETYKGELTLTDHKGAVDLETYKGEADVEFAGIDAACRFDTYKGSIIVRVPDKAGFNLRADLGRRVDFNADFSMERHRRRNDDERIRQVVNGGGPEFVFKSEKGNIRLRSL